MSGRELLSLKVTIPETPGSLLVQYQCFQA
jgi:hypothetical protein